jgi:hypothetical protein
MATQMAMRRKAYRSSHTRRVRIRNEARRLARWGYHWPSIIAGKRS